MYLEEDLKDWLPLSQKQRAGKRAVYHLVATSKYVYEKQRRGSAARWNPHVFLPSSHTNTVRTEVNGARVSETELGLVQYYGALGQLVLASMLTSKTTGSPA